jgi:hypothetical protein
MRPVFIILVLISIFYHMRVSGKRYNRANQATALARAVSFFLRFVAGTSTSTM